MDLTEDQLKYGIRAFCLAHEEIYPGTNVIAKIRKYALRQIERESAAEAWRKVLIGAKGSSVDLNNPIAAKVVRCMGGFRELGMSENIIADRAHFIRLYEQEVEKQNFKEMIGNANGELSGM